MSDATLQTELGPRLLSPPGARRLLGGGVGDAIMRRAVALGWLLVLPAIALPVWILGADRGWPPEQILPRPADVLQTLRDMLVSGELAQHASYSLLRVVYGFAIGAGAGVVIGSAMGLSKRVDDFVRPLFTAIAQVPALAWIPLAMLLLGIGEALKVVVIVKAAFVPVVMNTSAGIANVPRALVEVGETFRFTPLQMLRHVVLPGAVPPIFTGLRYGLTHAWIALVSVELLASSEGLGYLLVWGRQMFWLDTVLVGLVLGLSRIADRIVTTWFNGIKQIALLAWIPLISLWFGFDEVAKVVFIALAAAIPVILNLVEGVHATSEKFIEVGDVFRFSRLQFVVSVYLPSAIPSLLTGLHLALIYAWLASIGAEYFMAAGPGIGGLIIAGRERFDMDLVMLGIIVVGTVGFTVDRGATWLERRLIPWRTV